MGAMRVVKDFKALGRLWIRLAAAMAVFAVQCPTVAVANPFPYTLQWKRLVPGIGGGAVAWRDSLVYVGTTDGRGLGGGRGPARPAAGRRAARRNRPWEVPERPGPAPRRRRAGDRGARPRGGGPAASGV